MRRRNCTLQTLSLLLLFLTANLYGQCDKTTLKGSYGFVSSIRVRSKPGSAPIKVRFIGIVTYDGAGNAKASGSTIAPGGQSARHSLTGTYDVGPNCGGRVTLSDENNAQSVWGFVVVGGATELLSVSEKSDTDPFSQKKQ